MNLESTTLPPPAEAEAKPETEAHALPVAQPQAADPLWYKDAIIYQTHIKAFYDANNDGIGDFEGLIQKLDYIQELGVSAVWLLPFYPSPLRDDGYDIADYRAVNPSYGTLKDVRRLIQEAHKRGLKIITELVINHTSDQHPWFQRARRAKPGSRWRDYYVWSDTDQKYKDTRIIFLDTEKSNWTWDPEAKAYFWHRFYSHQPDLNFDNPRVMKEVLSVLHYWLEMGIDGLRLDAIPYLVEREGTNCENLSETHDVLKRIRAEIDQHFHGRMLLAEANQWPEDTRPYFGEGDECHMGFHFPLMPRMYMAIAQEDRHPITDIMRQTPDIPDNSQWAIFLRNHDELTLEMVTQNEREYLWNTYAADRRMRINLGIRRRLAPLMDNDRRKIELMKALLMSMPGTPVIYYGDEIGMGDNIFLGDRDGVRTPMQWSPDRNGGFSRAHPQRLYLPAIQDPIYGFNGVNVEAQTQSPGSFLNWMKRLIAVRQGRRTFGRGSITFLYPRNRKILAYLREHEGETILCVFNLSRNAQACDLELGRFRDRVPVELLGRTDFPPVADPCYRVTLPGYGFYWFLLAEAGQLGSWHAPAVEPLPEFITVVLQDSYKAVAESRGGRELAQSVLPEYLPNQRWFAAKDRKIERVQLADSAEIKGPGGVGTYLLAGLDVALQGAPAQRYLLPFTVAWGEEHLAQGAPLLPFTLAKARRGPKVGVLYDATHADGFARALVGLIHDGRTLKSGDLTLRAHAGARKEELAISPDAAVRRLGTEQSNSSLLVEERVMLKVYRQLHPGIHPEIEIGAFLTDVAGFPNTPPLLGWLEQAPGEGESTALAAAFGFVSNQGDGWRYTLDHLDRALEELRHTPEADRRPSEEQHELYLAVARLLGRRTAELHRAFATPTDDPAFAAEPVGEEDLRAWLDEARAQVEAGFAAIQNLRSSEALAAEIEAALAARPAVEAALATLETVPAGLVKTRLHGDYHLGQVLVAKGDIMIIDFEGEPARPLAERRAKSSPVRDVAGMLRSFDYAAWTGVQRFAESDPAAFDALLRPILAWRALVSGAFLEEYRATIGECPSWPREPAAADALLRLFTIQKLFYEVGYEAANRPTWLRIPLRAIQELFAAGEQDKGEGSGEARIG
jgi:maltose alpha-D-glucosyltransferase/alpha-amylase